VLYGRAWARAAMMVASASTAALALAVAISGVNFNWTPDTRQAAGWAEGTRTFGSVPVGGPVGVSGARDFDSDLADRSFSGGTGAGEGEPGWGGRYYNR
jgi:hypothetical protein